MPTDTTFLKLKIYNTTTDGSALFQTFRTDLAGISPTSNMNLIDTWASDVSGSVTSLGTGKGIIYVAANYVSANYYEATVADITSYISGQTINLSLNVTNDGTVTLKINALATVTVLKIGSFGSAVNMSSGDFKPYKEYLFRYNGTAWIWISANSIDQINAQGTWGNLPIIASGSVLGDSGIATISGSKIASAHIPINTGLIISSGSIIVNAGSGLALNSGSVTAVLGAGLKLSSGSISPSVANGIIISSGSIVISAGSGLKIASGSVVAQVSGSIITIDSSGSIEHKTSSASPVSYSSANISLDEYGHVLSANSNNGITNKLINGGGDIFQKQSTPSTEIAYANDTYCADRWILLTQTTSGCVSRQAGDTTSQYAIRIKQQAATEQRVGLLQILEGLNSVSMRNKDICFSGKVKTSISQTMRYAILDFGTQAMDTVVSDVINDWTSPYYTSGSFFLASGSCNVISSGSITSGSTGFVQFSTTGSAGASINNLGVFVWTSGSIAQNVTVDLTEMQFVQGTTNPIWNPKLINQELELCKWYYEIIKYPIAYGYYGTGYCSATTTFVCILPFTEKRVVPTISISSGTAFVVGYGSTSANTTNLTASYITTKNCRMAAITAAVLTIGDAGLLQGENSTTTHWIEVKAEL